jgi:hypothetical protein
MEGARGTGRQAVDFDAAESAFFQFDFEPYLFLTSDQKRSCITEERIMADEEYMFPILKTDETGDKMVDRAFGSEFGDLLEPVFQAKRFGDNLRGLARSNERAGEYSIEGYAQAA